uniref:Col_cuticle_N domain-containing protein n=1 Tax=Steinernema glaseri TaxID=37863 RepID=A0A1I7ZMM6_9BILA
MVDVKRLMYGSIGSVSLALGLLLLCVPLWIQSVDDLQKDMETELAIIMANSDDMWASLIAMESSPRIRRQDFLYQHGLNNVPAYGYGYTKLKCCCSADGYNQKDYSLHTTSYKCPVGSRGPPGPFGESGETGLDGQPGFNGEDYPSVLQTINPNSYGESDLYGLPKKDIYCEPCPSGPPGEPGPKGVPGLHGSKGVNGVTGKHGIPGIPGKVGPPGDDGPRGRPGRSGVVGPNGADGIKGGKGLPGLKGVPGLVGVSGPRGVAGPTGDYGLPGKQGPRGSSGVRGSPGQDGVDGVIGGPGKAGPDGLYCQCPQKTMSYSSSNSYNAEYNSSPAAPQPAPAPAASPSYSSSDATYKLSDAQAQYLDASYTKKIYNSIGNSNQYTRLPGPPGTRPPKRPNSGYSDQRAADWPRWPEATTSLPTAAVVDLNTQFGRQEWFRRRSKAKAATTTTQHRSSVSKKA